MTSVLNVGVMPTNPVGNQIRSLQTQIDNLRKENQMLLLALESKAPEVFAEVTRQKEEVAEAAARAQEAAQKAAQRNSYQSTQPSRASNGRF